MKLTTLILIGALMLAASTPAAAHHSLVGTYVLDQTSTIEGTIFQFTVRNPHSFISLDVKDSAGRVVRWGVEWDGATILTQTGVTAQTLKAGDRVTIIGRPSRDTNEHKVLMKVIRRPADGWSWGDKPEEVLKGYGGFSPN